MKKSTLALSALTLALAAGLSACGGGTSTYAIGGVVTGLEFPGLVLLNNGEELTVGPTGYTEVKDSSGKVIGKMPNNVDYTFKNEVEYGEIYNVTVKAEPPHQTCATYSGTSDTAGRLSEIQAVISCALVSNQISGKVTGLTSGELELTNGSSGGTVLIPANATEFVLPFAVTYGQTYGITVLKAPDKLTCTVSNGAGTMGDDPVTTVAVDCQPKA